MQRRILVLVALLALAALAGCHSAGRLGMTAVDDAGLADQASESVESDESDPGRYRPSERLLMRSAIENVSAYENDTNPPVDTDLPVEYDGRYYALTHESVGTVPGQQFQIGVDYNASDASGDRVDYESLPRVDRLAIRSEVVDPIEDPKRLEPGTDSYTIESYTDAEAERSVLVPTTQYDVVVYEGEAYPLRVRNRGNEDLTTYRYTSRFVAESSEAYASMLRDRYAFTLGNVTEEEAEVLESATGEEDYYPDSTADEGYDRLVDRLLEHTAVRKDTDHHSGSWIARYEGQLYWIEMDYDAFLEDYERDADVARDPIVPDPTPTASPTPESEGSPTAAPTGSPISVTPIETGDGDPTPTTATPATATPANATDDQSPESTATETGQ